MLDPAIELRQEHAPAVARPAARHRDGPAAGLSRGAGTVATTADMVGPDPIWDARVAASRGGDLVQTSLWAQTRRCLGMRTVRVAVADSGGEPLGGCMMYVKQVLPGVRVAAVPRGPVLFADPAVAAAPVVRHVVAEARRRGIRMLVLQVPDGADALDQALEAAGFRHGISSIAPEATVTLDLRLPEEALLAAMSANRRHNLRRALRSGFTVEQSADMAAFHRLHVLTAARQGFAPLSLVNLEAQHDLLAPGGQGALFMASHGGQPVAGLWLTRFAGTVTSKLVGWDATYDGPPGASEALRWATVLWAREQGAHTYDLGGLDRRLAERLEAGEPPGAWCQSSISRFKLGLGGTPVLLPRARFAYTNALAGWALGGLTRRFLASPTSHRIIQRWRNG
ncbi:MAG TPA: GNAT family N-acetyltransferase [Azospirillaceae bacterium]|nr:GNAT family N-acetyltransferase [Azospirillaceae bacterium]